MSCEMELFKAGEVKMTAENLSVGSRSFSMSNIRSVEVIYHHRTWKRELVLLAVAAVCEMFGVVTNAPLLQMAAVVLLMAAATIFWKGSPRYSLAIESQQGRMVAFTSTDRFLVEKVGQHLHSLLEPSAARRSYGKVVPFREHSVYSRVAG